MHFDDSYFLLDYFIYCAYKVFKDNGIIKDFKDFLLKRLEINQFLFDLTIGREGVAVKMSDASALQIQWFLNALLNDCLGCTYLASDNHPNRWQFAVEAVYCLKSSDLVDFDFDVLHKSDKVPNSMKHFSYL